MYLWLKLGSFDNLYVFNNLNCLNIYDACFIKGCHETCLSDNFSCQLITFANGLNPGQARQNVRPDLDPNV